MAFSSADVFSKGTITFEVGTLRRTFHVHIHLVSQVSKLLSDAIRNEFLDNNVFATVKLSSITADTFHRFAEWLYTLDYSCVPPSAEPDPRTVKDMSIPSESEAVHLDEDKPVAEQPESSVEANGPPETEDVFISPSSNKKKKKEGKKSRASFNFVGTPEGSLAVDETPATVPVGDDLGKSVFIGRFLIKQAEFLDQGPNRSYSDSFLVHTQLYVFARQIDIEGLAPLAARKLQHALEGFKHYNPRAVDVVDLARYVYENTHSSDYKPDSLRLATADSIANNFRDLIRTEEFLDLWRQGGDLVEDVGSKLGQRLVDLERRVPRRGSLILWHE